MWTSSVYACLARMASRHRGPHCHNCEDRTAGKWFDLVAGLAMESAAEDTAGKMRQTALNH